MTTIWIIAPNQSDDIEKFNNIWKHNTENNNISIGWDKLPANYADLPQSKQLELTKIHYPDDYKTLKSSKHVAKTFEYFYKSIEVGDFIVARFGKSKIVGIGIVTQKSIFDENSILAIKYHHPHICGINWFYTQEINYEEKNSYKKLPRQTIVSRELSEFPEKVQNIINKYVADKLVYQLPSDEEKELSAFEGKIIEKWRMNRFIERSSKLVQDY